MSGAIFNDAATSVFHRPARTQRARLRRYDGNRPKFQREFFFFRTGADRRRHRGGGGSDGFPSAVVATAGSGGRDRALLWAMKNCHGARHRHARGEADLPAPGRHCVPLRRHGDLRPGGVDRGALGDPQRRYDRQVRAPHRHLRHRPNQPQCRDGQARLGTGISPLLIRLRGRGRRVSCGW